MTATTHTLTSWLLAQIEADEQAARKAAKQNLGGPLIGWNADSVFLTANPMMDAADRNHIATHDPARVLRQCEKFREIVAEHSPLNEDATIWVCRSCQPPGTWPNGEPYPCPTLRALAGIYADRPGAEAWLGDS